MMHTTTFFFFIALFSGATLSLSAQDTASPKSKNLEEVVVLGSRRVGRTSTTSAAPVDILSANDLQANGFTQTIQAISNVLPSFTAKQSSIDDGSDYVRPATLRGLGPEHVLVLVNGKKRHQSALVHVNSQTRGSVGVDLNTIPSQLIERIEVLRDGASAQYGSDAIAGVINIVLKKSKELSVSATYGQFLSAFDRGYGQNEGLSPGETNAAYTKGNYRNDWATGALRETVLKSDGQSVSVNVGKGFSLGQDGTLYVGAQVRRQGRSNRQGIDPRMQYFGTLANGSQTTSADAVWTQPGGQFDTKEATFDRENKSWYGQSELTDLNLSINGELPLRNKQDVLYANAGYSYRIGLGPCYFRRPLDDRTIRSKYPDGFLPQINPIVTDFSGTLGYKLGLPHEWKADVSSTFGRSAFEFRVTNAANTSFGKFAPENPSQKTDYFNGTLAFLQSTSNIDVSKSVAWGNHPLNVAFGGEVRFEQFTLTPGEEASFADGKVLILDGPNRGKQAAAACQCFPGYRDLVEHSRIASGVYLDLERDFTDNLTLGLAGRYEYYSDFGSTLNGKVSLHWQFSKLVGFRATASTGFRAPGLQQAFYSSVATVASGSSFTETGTFPVNHPVAEALGAQPLRAEKSINVSSGFTFKSSTLKITLDGYYIILTDRVVLSEDFQGIPTNVSGQKKDELALFLESKGVQATSGRYFTNALNTRTYGVDFVVTWNALRINDFKWDITFAANYNKTEITNKADVQTPEILKQYSNTPLLSNFNITRMENNNPQYVANLSFNFSLKHWGFLLRNTLYGPYVIPYLDGEQYNQTMSPTLTTNVEVSYRFGKQNHFLAAIGSNNLFDVYPDKILKSQSFNGIFQYGPSPIGFNGRYVYARIALTL